MGDLGAKLVKLTCSYTGLFNVNSRSTVTVNVNAVKPSQDGVKLSYHRFVPWFIRGSLSESIRKEIEVYGTRHVLTVVPDSRVRARSWICLACKGMLRRLLGVYTKVLICTRWIMNICVFHNLDGTKISARKNTFCSVGSR